MKAKKQIVMVLVSLGVVGCASAPKPEMPEEKYQEFATVGNAVTACVNANYFSVEANTTAIRVLGTQLNSWNYDRDKLRAIAKTTEVSITEVECNKMAATILATQQRWDRQASQAASQPTPVYIPQTRNTFCNRVGTQLLCNSF